MVLRGKKLFKAAAVVFCLFVAGFAEASTFSSAASKSPAITDADWVSVKSGFQGTNGSVYALAVDGSGNVYAGGMFWQAGDINARCIAKWDGSSWWALGDGMNHEVNALAFDAAGNLYAGGYFTTAGGAAANYIAKWDGTSWTALGDGMNGTVFALAVDAAGAVFAGGSFTTAGGVAADHIAKWDGKSWTALGTGMNDSVYALAADISGSVYAGGEFTTAGGITANHIAKWDGAAWSAFGRGIDRTVIYAVAVDESGAVYAGGSFTVADNATADNGTVRGIAKWDGSSWSALGAGITGSARALAVDAAGNLYAGGWFTAVGGSSSKGIAKWDGASWSPLGSGVSKGYPAVYALALDVSGSVYAGGLFNEAGDIAAEHIAKWDGTSWLAVGAGGINNSVRAVAVDAAGNLYAGGEFTTAGGVAASRIAKWDGSSWSALGAGITGSVHALAVDAAGNLYAGGFFWKAGDVGACHVAKWDGAKWSALGDGMDGRVTALAADADGTVYAGGEFTTAGGVEANCIARWDGMSWSALGTGMEKTYSQMDDFILRGRSDPLTVAALAIDADGNVYAGGNFNRASGVEANCIAKWNGQSWSALGRGMRLTYGYWDYKNGGLLAKVYSLALDKAGNLYAGGDFTRAGGAIARGIAKWNGLFWTGLGAGIRKWYILIVPYNPIVSSVAVAPSGVVYAGGIFSRAGVVAAHSVAKWDGLSWSALGSGIAGCSVTMYGGPSTVHALALDPAGDLYAGGSFLSAGGKPSLHIAKCLTGQTK